MHRNVERKAGIEPATSTLATLCSATELHPQISERVRPSRFHVLQNFTSLRALTRNITHSSHRVLDSHAGLAHGEHQRVCATPG